MRPSLSLWFLRIKIMDKVLFTSVTEILFLTTWLSVVIWYIQYLWKRKKLYTYCKKIKGPFALPLIGSAYCFLQGNLDDSLGILLGLFTKYPGIAKFWHAQELMFLISDPEIAQVALTSPKAFSKSSLYLFLEDGLGHGLFTAPSPKWKKSRKHLNPVFSKQMLNNFKPVYVEYGEKLNRSITKVLQHGEILDVYKVVKKHVLNILCETLMGIELTGQSEDDFSYHVDKGRNISFCRIINVLYHNDFVFKLSKDYRDLQDSLNFLKNFVRNVIEQQRCVLNNNKRNALFDAEIEESTKKTTFLQCVLESPLEGYTTEDIQNEIYTFLTAGSDTTTNSICFALMLLAMHPEIQTKVYNEVIDILGTEREMQPEDIDKFEYLERVLKETLRLFPAGPLLGRTLEGDLKLKDGTTLPQGCTFVVGIFTIHRNEKYWKNPLNFDPDRFLPENYAKQQTCTYMPFSYGPRNCIANKFAMVSMKVLMASMVRKFLFKTNCKTVEDIETSCGVVLQPKNGFDVQLVPRTIE